MAKKKIKEVVTIVADQPKGLWERIKGWFWHSEAILLAWITGIIGTVTAAVSGILASADFSSIFTMLQSGATFTKQNLIVMGVGALGMGAVQYWARVRGTKEVSGRLLPTAEK